MFDLSALSNLLPTLLLAAGILIGVNVASTQDAHIRTLTVPSAWTSMGLPPEVVELRVRNNILAIERQAHIRPEHRRLTTHAERSGLQLLGDYLNLTPISRMVQDASGLLEYVVIGSIARIGESHVVQLMFRRADGQQMLVTISRPAAEIDEILQDTALAFIRVVDPQVLCTLHLREGLQGDPRGVDAAQGCIADTLPVAA